RRWDWDYATVRDVLGRGRIGRPRLVESAVCRSAAPRGWRGSAAAAGTVLHDWGARLGGQGLQLCLGPWRRLAALVGPGPWEGADSGGHGRIVLEFDDLLFQVETSRVCPIDRPRWWIVGTEGGFVKFGVDPQEEALRAGDIDRAAEPAAFEGILRRSGDSGTIVESRVPTVRTHWDEFYRNIAEHLAGRSPLAVTAERGREAVRVLESATRASREHRVLDGPWGD